MKKSKSNNNLLRLFGIIIVLVIIYSALWGENGAVTKAVNKNRIVVLSSYENKVNEDAIVKYARKNKVNVQFKYMGDLDIVSELNTNSSNYDAVWISNSMWLYMLNNTYLTSDSKSISISPVVFGIKKKKAEELGLIDKDVTNNDILDLVRNKKIKYVMSSVTQTNTGATAYLGFLESLAGNPEVLTEEMLNDPELVKNLTAVFSGVERVSGDEDYLSEMFLNDDDFEAVIAAESSLIDINNNLVKKKKDPLYLIYPTDGVAVNDSTFAFINNTPEKEEGFLKLQGYLLSDEGQKMLASNGLRTWYGGVNPKADRKVFNNNWGIDTNKYLNVTKFPSKDIITKAINLYIEELRKPTHVVFCLDYSGSMSGSGEEELENAMRYILDYDTASKDKLQFSKKDKITVVTFSSNVKNVWTIDNGRETSDLIDKIDHQVVGGSTALYDAIIRGLDILENESNDYTKTIIAMTDGEINVGSYLSFSNYYKRIKSRVPVYSIMFGDASDYQLNQISELTNAKTFDGKKDLLQAFKEVRSYN